VNHRIKRLASCFCDDKNAAMITSSVNRFYYTGFSSSSGILLITSKKAWLLVDFRYYEAARKKALGLDIVLLENAGRQVKAVIAGEKITRLSSESRSLSVSDWLSWKKELSPLELSADNKLSDYICSQRKIKDRDEIASLLRAQNIADSCFEEILNHISPGISEKQIAFRLACFLRERGADRESFDIIALTGPNTSLPHGTPSERLVEAGDFVLLDFGVKKDGYCSDMTRTIAVKHISDEKHKVYETVLAAHLAARSAIIVGTTCRHVDKAARDVIDNSIFKGSFGHSTGHSLGLEIHEQPIFSPSSADIVEPGLVMSVEPGIYLENKFGCRIEDVVSIEKDKSISLTEISKELLIV
jgi:Xaa-Pro aminopeptidase